ncbi:hypothetical protein KCP71_17535 [Salmonella enterica subsp. enterica]|nr:hypothetical protein KCP71_17535 [Salmonella enterica subsp. enterica]
MGLTLHIKLSTAVIQAGTYSLYRRRRPRNSAGAAPASILTRQHHTLLGIP